ncbi:unnamed protein product [Ixodes persulcatus]
MAARKNVSCGLDLVVVDDFARAVNEATSAGYKFVAVDISHPQHTQDLVERNLESNPTLFRHPDIVLSSHDWSSLVVLKISQWLDVDSSSEPTRKLSETVLERELSYAAYVRAPAVIIHLKGPSCVNLARLLYNYLLNGVSYQLLFHIWIVLPIASGSIEGAPHSCKSAGVAGGKGDGMAADATDQDPWEWWNRFRSICATDKRLGVALRLTANLPSEEHLLRWYGEPVWCLLVPTTLFLTNKKGYPVLSKSHQAVIRQFFKLNCQVLVEGCCHHKHMRHYYQYIDHLYNTQPPENPLGEFARGYEDQLQIPLQPLMDNLESVTYEIFEKDPVKYTEYQKAIYMALTDRKEEFGSSEIVLMVLGAGRGPLVRAALNAAEAADQKIKIYAIEKNPNAVLTLLSLKEKVWKDKVTVVSCDMREYEPPDKADIVVSELLGSFGDNELAPECLDGAQRFLKDDGISIPCSYQSYLGPIQSHKLYSDVASLREKDKHPLAAFEMPYVVQLQNIAVPASPQPLFSFVHPNKEEKIDNSRYKSLKFEIKDNYVLHGFAGYFDCVLYKDISLSIYPNSHSPGMFSWFPIYFPIKDPVNLVKGSAVEVRFWRCVAKRKVWYEWLVVQPHLGTVHNPCGRSHTMGL